MQEVDFVPISVIHECVESSISESYLCDQLQALDISILVTNRGASIDYDDAVKWAKWKWGNRSLVVDRFLFRIKNKMEGYDGIS